MSFRKRKPLNYISSGSCMDLVESPDGRTLVKRSIEDYNLVHELPNEEFTLSQELSAGVPIKEIPCGNLLDSGDPLEHPIDTVNVSNMLNPQNVE